MNSQLETLKNRLVLMVGGSQMIAQVGASHTFEQLHKLASPVPVYTPMTIDGYEVPPSTMPPALKMSLLEQVWYSERYVLLTIAITLILAVTVFLVYESRRTTEKVRRVFAVGAIFCSIGVSVYAMYAVVASLSVLTGNLPNG